MGPYDTYSNADKIFVDGGRNNWKVVTGDGCRNLIPNVIGTGPLDSLAMESLQGGDPGVFPGLLLFEYEGETYGIGRDTAVYYSADPRSPRAIVPGRQAVKTDDPLYVAMFSAVLAYLGQRGNGRLYVEFTLPPDPYRQSREKVELQLRKTHTVRFLSGPYAGRECSVEVSAIRARCEAVAAFSDILLDDQHHTLIRSEAMDLLERPDPINPTLRRPIRVGVLGVGGHTTNLATFLKGVPQEYTIQNIDNLGMMRALENIRRELNLEFGARLTPAQLLTELQYSETFVGGTRVNLLAAKDRHYGALARDIYDTVVKDYWREVYQDLEYLILVGGGAAALLPALQQIFGQIKSLTDHHRFIMPADPLWSDANGMRKRHLFEYNQVLKKGFNPGGISA